jgi:hypothetical protein
MKRTIKVKAGDSMKLRFKREDEAARLKFRVQNPFGNYAFRDVENINFTGPATIEIEYEEEPCEREPEPEEIGTVD